ncbi:unnamed protein product [Schistosoma mattheei]|uniref:Uncharacterized protein n=1 Tax=Schistosoma mattheei TaxID=31246 RepID=A0A3P8D2M4_9TREM|nr:unnamed protein product [Schistosoma mattheei]
MLLDSPYNNISLSGDHLDHVMITSLISLCIKVV